jgi:hypothetical protein
MSINEKAKYKRFTKHDENNSGLIVNLSFYSWLIYGWTVPFALYNDGCSLHIIQYALILCFRKMHETPCADTWLCVQFYVWKIRYKVGIEKYTAAIENTEL